MQKVAKITYGDIMQVLIEYSVDVTSKNIDQLVGLHFRYPKMKLADILVYFTRLTEDKRWR